MKHKEFQEALAVEENNYQEKIREELLNLSGKELMKFIDYIQYNPNANSLVSNYITMGTVYLNLLELYNQYKLLEGKF